MYGNGLLMIGKYFRKRRTLATGLAVSGASIGQFVLAPIIEYLLENYGVSGTLLIISACYFHTCVAGMLFRPIDQYGPEVMEVKESREEVGTDVVQFSLSNVRVWICLFFSSLLILNVI